jgi:hypothetical protein
MELFLDQCGSWWFVCSSVRYWGDGVKLIYRHYATLYFVFAVDQQESDLGILDLIQGTFQWHHLTAVIRRGC